MPITTKYDTDWPIDRHRKQSRWIDGRTDGLTDRHAHTHTHKLYLTHTHPAVILSQLTILGKVTVFAMLPLMFLRYLSV